VINLNKDVNRLAVLKYMALISNQMMLREFEVLIWATINQDEHIADFIKEKDA
jgi:hypothetical protein